jgi:predicted ABC-type ATPase
MISLQRLLLEVFDTQPKAIILSGAAGMGKSTLINDLVKHIPSNFVVFNPDTFNPEDNPDKPNISKNNFIIRTKAIPDAINNKQNFIYDTTGQNFKETADIVAQAQQSGYKVMVITLYGSPIVSFLRNFNRSRKLPKDVVLNNWAKVYNQISSYGQIPGIEYLVVQTELSPQEKADISKFEKALKSNELEEYFKQIIQQDPEKYRSSFRKVQPSDIKTSEDLPDPETLKQREEKKKEAEKKFNDAIKNIKDQFKTVEKYLKVIKPLNYKEAIGAIKTFAKP